MVAATEKYEGKFEFYRVNQTPIWRYNTDSRRVTF